MTTKVLGASGEDAAAAYLAARGWTIVARNYRVREGEIDIVGRRGDVLAFVEVKTRRSRRFGSPAEAVTFRKQARIRRLARRWLQEGGERAPVVRFDVIEVDAELRVRHIEAAF